ncbi:hypothetical protein RO3G_02762 [Lichtheimia corymbifera JMRC:FSU:9682]|uniref:BHLH domain-containing protein n=1 Tax=Lichtheimia corymbifera JMRC:FSU:9682 TaxID=1263082 RepID=A0A068RG86_9FUNG|nr:hypothetical protein RO3G_02762 [Lichtheimia corymbifera JMRC:FSU:9682]
MDPASRALPLTCCETIDMWSSPMPTPAEEIAYLFSKDDNAEKKQRRRSKSISSLEIRRQIHIQSEQKRRAQIKDGFEELRNQLPACLNKKMSKVTLLHRTVQHIQHLKRTQMSILAEMERLMQENEELRKFQQSVTIQQDGSAAAAAAAAALYPSPVSTMANQFHMYKQDQ